MTNELSEKLFSVLLDISKSLKPVPFWENYNFLLSVVGVAALVGTLYFLVRYTRATEKMATYQVIPAIDVNMVYEESVRKTYFWFSNESSLPGLVFLERKKNKGNREKVYQPLRIPPRRKMRTATTFDFSPTEGDELILYVLIKPSLDKSNIKFEFEKSYRFSNNKWNETSWSFPDPPFPNPINPKYGN